MRCGKSGVPSEAFAASLSTGLFSVPIVRWCSGVARKGGAFFAVISVCRVADAKEEPVTVSTEADFLPAREVLSCCRSWRSRVGTLLKAVEHAGRCRF
jgi:hypothetical protein